MNKITIIGSGSVGSTIAYTLTVQGIASEIVMIDINEEKAKGEALDIRQGVPFCTPCSVYAGSYEDAKDSDIVIITSGIARKPGQTRLDLAQTNVNIIKSITPNITKYAPDAIYLSSATRLISSPIRSASAPAFRSPASSVPVPSSIPPVCVHVSPSTTRSTSRTYTLTFWASTATAPSCRGPLRTSPTSRQTHTRRLWKTPTAC